MTPNWKQLSLDQKTIRLGPMLAEGLSASEIARHFEGATRCSIVGFVFRSKTLEFMSSGNRTASQSTKRKAPPKDKQPKPAPARVIAPPVSLMGLKRGRCKYPVERILDDTKWLFCGAPALDGKPYCERHEDVTLWHKKEAM